MSFPLQPLAEYAYMYRYRVQEACVTTRAQARHPNPQATEDGRREDRPQQQQENGDGTYDVLSCVFVFYLFLAFFLDFTHGRTRAPQYIYGCLYLHSRTQICQQLLEYAHIFKPSSCIFKPLRSYSFTQHSYHN